MSCGVQVHTRSHLDFVADSDEVAVEEHAIEVEKAAIADADVEAVIASEVGSYGAAFTESTEQLAKYRSRGIAFTDGERVELCRQQLGSFPIGA